jgi:hypothetical protein
MTKLLIVSQEGGGRRQLLLDANCLAFVELDASI